MATTAIDPQSIGAALVIARAVEGILFPLIVAAVLGVVAWASWLTWAVRSIQQTGKAMASVLSDLSVTQKQTDDRLEEHRRDDAANFATLKAEMSFVDRIIDRGIFWKKAEEDRARLA